MINTNNCKFDKDINEKEEFDCKENLELNEQINEFKKDNKIYFDNLRDTIKYKIYIDLKNRGFYITTGLKYGADFLLYSGNQIITIIFIPFILKNSIFTIFKIFLVNNKFR